MQRRVLYLMLTVVAVLAGTHVWVALHIQDLGYETEYVNRLIARLDRERLELQTEEARETTPGLVAERARAIGLNLPERGQIRRLHAQP